HPEAEVCVEVVQAELPLGRGLLEPRRDRVAVGVVAHGRTGQGERGTDHVGVDEALELHPAVLVQVVDFVVGHGPARASWGGAHAKIPGPVRNAYSPTASSGDGV